MPPSKSVIPVTCLVKGKSFFSLSILFFSSYFVASSAKVVTFNKHEESVSVEWKREREREREMLKSKFQKIYKFIFADTTTQ